VGAVVAGAVLGEPVVGVEAMVVVLVPDAGVLCLPVGAAQPSAESATTTKRASRQARDHFLNRFDDLTSHRASACSGHGDRKSACELDDLCIADTGITPRRTGEHNDLA
jgi:hypothetical protein